MVTPRNDPMPPLGAPPGPGLVIPQSVSGAVVEVRVLARKFQEEVTILPISDWEVVGKSLGCVGVRTSSVFSFRFNETASELELLPADMSSGRSNGMISGFLSADIFRDLLVCRLEVEHSSEFA